jgi:hypothetical protein
MHCVMIESDLHLSRESSCGICRSVFEDDEFVSLESWANIPLGWLCNRSPGQRYSQLAEYFDYLRTLDPYARQGWNRILLYYHCD